VTATETPFRVGALCAGYGGLELGLQAAGIPVALKWYAEIDKRASQVMSHHYPDAPNLGDLTEITDCPPVDVVTAGFPCQPVSHAGKREGVNDARWLIDDVCKIARRVDAGWLLLENVAGIFTANKGEAFYRVLSALAENGFAAEWTSVRASDVGASHKRLRWFCLAYADKPSGKARRNTGFDSKLSRSQLVGLALSAANANMSRRSKRHGRVSDEAQLPAPERPSPDAARWGAYAAAIQRWEPIVGRPSPDPTDEKGRLNPRFVEWMMGLPDGWVCDAVQGRTHQLRILGNGVVPQQAAYALELLVPLVGEQT